MNKQVQRNLSMCMQNPDPVTSIKIDDNLSAEFDHCREDIIGTQIRDQDDADDLKQEFSLRMLSLLKEHEDIEKVVRYLRVSASHLVHDYHRQRKGKRSEVPMDTIREPTSEACRPEEHIEKESMQLAKEKRHKLLNETVMTLPYPYRECVLMRYYIRFPYSYKEIKQKLDLQSINAVGVHLRDARKMLRKRLLARESENR